MAEIEYQSMVEEISDERPEILFMRNAHTTVAHKWSAAIGIVEMVIGFLTAFIGTVEVIIIPVVEMDEINLNRQNCYGIGIIAGLVMVITGSTALRASISRRPTTAFRYYRLTFLTLLVYLALTLLIVIVYFTGWTKAAAYPPGSRVYVAHMFLTVSAVLGLLFMMSIAIHYYDTFYQILRECWMSICVFVEQRFFTRNQTSTIYNIQHSDLQPNALLI